VGLRFAPWSFEDALLKDKSGADEGLVVYGSGAIASDFSFTVFADYWAALQQYLLSLKVLLLSLRSFAGKRVHESQSTNT